MRLALPSLAVSAQGRPTSPGEDQRARPTTASSGASSVSSLLHITIGRALGTVVVTLRGSLERDDAETLRAVLKDLIEHQGNLKVVVDLHRLRCLDITGVRVLRVAAGWARSHDASFRLANPPFRLSPALRAAGLAPLLLFLSNKPDVLRVRCIDRVALQVDLTILVRLAPAPSDARAVPLAA